MAHSLDNVKMTVWSRTMSGHYKMAAMRISGKNSSKTFSATKGSTGFKQASMSKIQGLLKASPTVFKDLN